MKIERPRFELTRVFAGGESEAPEIVPVTAMPWDTRMDRRGALGVGLGAAAALFLLESQGEAHSVQTTALLKAPEKAPPAHLNAVSALALTPDGKLLLSGSQDNTVKLWSLPQGQWLATLPIHTSDVSALAVTPDSKLLVAASGDTLRLLSLPDGQLQATLDAHTDTINAIAISADGKLLISAANDRTLRLWGLPEGRLLATLEGHTGAVRSLALAQNGRLLASAGKENRVRIWSLPEARLLMTLPGYANDRFAITPDSRMIAIGSYEIALRSLTDGRLLMTLRPGAGESSDMAISPDGKILVTVARDTLLFWSLPDGKQIRKLEKVGYTTGGLVFSSDSRLLFAGGGYESGRLWSVADGQLLGQLQVGNQLRVARFTADNQRLVTGTGGGGIALWNTQPPGFGSYLVDPAFTASKAPDKRLLAHTGAVTALAISADGKLLASAGQDHTAKLWSLPGGQLLAALEGHKEGLNDAAILPDGKTVITAAGDRGIRLWELPPAPGSATPATKKSGNKPASQTARSPGGKTTPKGRLLATLEGHQASVERVKVSLDGQVLVSADAGGAIKIWSLPEGRLQATLAESKNDLQSLALAPDGKLLATTTASGTREERSVRLWALPEGRLLMSLAGHAGQITALAITPDGKNLVVASDDNSMRVWELPGGRLLGSMEGPDATALSFTPDGKLLAAGSTNGVTLWSMTDGRLLASLEEQRDNFGNNQAMTMFAGGGRRLLALVAGGQIKMWSAPECQLQATLATQLSGSRALALTPDGQLLATGDYSGVITLWDLDKPGFRTYLFDAAANAPEVKGLAYNVYDQVTGQTITYTLPCGSPIPPNAVCTCNCVPGTERAYTPPPAPKRSSGGRSSGGRSGGGGYCICNKVCTCIPVPSDRNLKEAFEATDPLTILRQLAQLPIQKWHYKWDDATLRHIGPMAQDFAAAFGVGEDDQHISPVDAQGVAFAAIQGLYQLVCEKEALVEEQRQITCELGRQLQSQQRENEALKERVERVERLLFSRSQ